jgi:dienelactone hydrolase
VCCLFKDSSLKPLLCLLALLALCNLSLAQKQHFTEREISIYNEGWNLKGDLLKAKSKSPIVVLLNKANGNRQVYKQLAQLLKQKGIASLRIDLRGHGESINLGKFIPFDSANNSKIHLENTYSDIIAIHTFLLTLEIDANKIAFIGASYSAEAMMEAARYFKTAFAYVALSPGSFSSASISSLDSLKTPMLFIKSMDEKSMQGFENDVYAKSSKAKFFIVAGKNHATDILINYPEVAELICDWLDRYCNRKGNSND